jgi:hypothetical protein
MKSILIATLLVCALSIVPTTVSAQCAGGICGLGGGRLVHRERTRERTGIVRRVASVLPVAVIFKSIRERRGR